MLNHARYGTVEARREIAASVDNVKRADTNLRPIAVKVGDATMCRKCDGAGYVPRPLYGWTDDHITKCRRCGGEGLEPKP